MKYFAYIRRSLDTIYYDSKINGDNLDFAKMFMNEAFSFQLAFRAEYEQNEANGWDDVVEIRAEIESPLQDKINVYITENVPAIRVGYSTADDWFERKHPGLYPDCLRKTNHNYFSAPVGYWKGIRICVNEDLSEIEPGNYDIGIRFYKRKDNTLVAENALVLEVMPASLPKQDMIVTNWIHYDCISYFSKTAPFSDEYYHVLKKYIRAAAANGQNMILTPAFTPPLDTPVGEERQTVQLVSVVKDGGKYEFDFSELKRFIDMSLECGMEYFEHSHLYTQWGAEHAPKIVVTENGKQEKLFGWHTDANSSEYRAFLHSYISELKKFLKRSKLENRFFFHVSDEPDEKHIQSYESAAKFLQGELGEYPSGDALSEYRFYENGLVQTPIVVTRSIERFIGKADPLWLYYTGYECDGNMPNRILGMPQERGRILGVQLYYFHIKGFLNWAFNAHHNRLSRRMIHPRMSSDMDCDFVGGTSYLVYPNENDVDLSARLITMREQMQDTRAFRLLESITSREHVLSVIRKHIPDISFHCRVRAEQITNLRNDVNEEIKRCLAKCK